MTFSYNANKHEYRIDGRIVPSVTQILDAVFGEPVNRATDWHMERGKVVHACAALIAQGKDFDCDPQVEGYVRAIRKFFVEMKPEVLRVEMQVYSEAYQYAGALDMLCVIENKLCVLEWKNTMDEERCKLQLALYSLCGDLKKTKPVRWGMGVELHEDGTYKTLGMWDLRRPQQEAMAVRTVYSIMQRMGLHSRDKKA